MKPLRIIRDAIWRVHGSEVNVQYSIQMLSIEFKGSKGHYYKQSEWFTLMKSPNESGAVETCDEFANKHPGQKWRVVKETSEVIYANP